MKKITAFLLALITLFSLTACSDNAEEAQPQDNKPVAIEVEGLLSESGPYFEYTYSDHVIDEKGQLIQVKVSGDSNRTDVYEYDEKDRLVKETRTSHYGEEIWTYTYDEDGNLISEFQGDRTFNNTYTFDEQGRILTKTAVNADPESDHYTIVYEYTYNDDGTIATEKQSTENSVYLIIFEYDDKGRVIEERAVKEGDGSSSTTRYTYGVIGSYIPAE